jgi:hypothetical protein
MLTADISDHYGRGGERMLTIQLRRTLTPEESGEHACSLCGESVTVEGVYAWPVTDSGRSIEDGGMLCVACLLYFSLRNPERYPSIEEYVAALARYPEPVVGSEDEMARLEEEDEELAYEVYAAALIR